MMNWKAKLKSAFYKQVLTLAVGTGLAQIINFAGIVVLARIYSPGEFAFFAVFNSIAYIIAAICCFRYEFVVPLPKEDKVALEIAALAYYILLIVCTLTFLGIFIFQLTSNYNHHQFNPYLYLVPVFCFFIGGSQIFNYWSTRIGTFNRNFISRVFAALTVVLGSVLFGLIFKNSLGLILGAICGQVVSWIILARHSLSNFWLTFKTIRFKRIKELAIEYKKFPIYNAPNALFDSFQDYGVIFLLSYFFTEEITSYYFQSFRLLGAPLALIGASIYQVFYPQAAKMYISSGNIRPFIIKIYKTLFIIGFPAFVILFFYTDEIFTLILGKKWVGTAHIAHILIPWLFLNFLISPVSGITLIAGKQKQAFLFSITGFILKFTSLIIGGIYKSADLAFVLVSVSGGTLMILGIIWYWYIALRHDKVMFDDNIAKTIS